MKITTLKSIVVLTFLTSLKNVYHLKARINYKILSTCKVHCSLAYIPNIKKQLMSTDCIYYLRWNLYFPTAPYKSAKII